MTETQKGGPASKESKPNAGGQEAVTKECWADKCLTEPWRWQQRGSGRNFSTKIMCRNNLDVLSRWRRGHRRDGVKQPCACAEWIYEIKAARSISLSGEWRPKCATSRTE
jgi:hypothetical protein